LKKDGVLRAAEIIKMAVHYRTQGFIIKKADRGEDSQLFTVYTKDFGRVEILGKAIRKIKSKLRSGTELFYFSEIEFIQGKTHKTLTDAILIDKFQNLRKSLKRLKIVRQIAELLDELVIKEERDEQIWQLLKEVFEKLNSLKKTEIIYYYFFWHLVSILGYQPELHRGAIGGRAVNPDIIKILKVIFKKDWSILARLRIEPVHQKLLKNTAQWYNEKVVV
jgi:DNA repair protein RecO (recombination protein O)